MILCLIYSCCPSLLFYVYADRCPSSECQFIFIFLTSNIQIWLYQYRRDYMRGPQIQQHYFDEKMDEPDQIFNQELQREKENQAAQFTKIKLRDLFPSNYLQEKEKFFNAKGLYSPHFMYKTIVYPEPLTVHTEYEQIALKILKNSPSYDIKTPLLTEQQVRKKIQQYLQQLGLKDYVQIKMEFQCLSRTSVSFFKNKAVLKVRTPLEYTNINLQGVLNHEIGTHILRMLNHKQNCVRKPSQKGKVIQEGLAALNQLLPQQKPFLFKPALRYLAAIYASKYGFQEVFKRINKFLPERDECWRECVRVKRGIGNTQEKGGFYKDQNYLVGAILILRNRHNIDFEKLYYGRFAPQQSKNLINGVLPPFLGTEQKLKMYKKKLQKIALCNFIDLEEKASDE